MVDLFVDHLISTFIYLLYVPMVQVRASMNTNPTYIILFRGSRAARIHWEGSLEKQDTHTWLSPHSESLYVELRAMGGPLYCHLPFLGRFVSLLCPIPHSNDDIALIKRICTY